ncbi:hypothetical protein OIV83_006016 [Microbotryomycetes sp. JL201]|nr:hypothetical protein OIV83_006016 [Microbotryomycetes sp. JL201]
MGVTALWKVIEDLNAVDHSTIQHLAAMHFNRNEYHGFRLGIDATAWHYHVRNTPDKWGVNADVRILFLRILGLMCHGVLPIFVFDGHEKPAWKNSPTPPATEAEARRIRSPFPTRSPHSLLTRLLDILGLPWLVAKGDGEAELAFMANRGEIDAILSDDSDVLLFGGPKVLRHNSLGLSGNKDIRPLHPHVCEDAPDGIPYEKDHSYRIYTLKHIEHLTGLDRASFVLIGLLTGADYAGNGVGKIGMTGAQALARCDFGDDAPRLGPELVAKYNELRHEPGRFQLFLKDWKERIAVELETNTHKMSSQRNFVGAKALRQDSAAFSIPVLDAYLDPPVHGHKRQPITEFDKDIPVADLVLWCIDTFQWSKKEVETTLCRSLYPYFVHREIRQAAIAIDKNVPRSLSQFSLSVPTGSVVCNIVQRQTKICSGHVDSYTVEMDKDVVARTTRLALPEIDKWPDGPHNVGTGRRTAELKDLQIGDWRHDVPVKLIKSHPLFREMADAWEHRREEKKRRKAEEAAAVQARKAEREERRRLGLSASPQKSKVPPTSQRNQKISSYLSPTKPSVRRESAAQQTKGQSTLLSVAEQTKADFVERVRRARTPTPDNDSEEFSDEEIRAAFDNRKSIFSSSDPFAPRSSRQRMPRCRSEQKSSEKNKEGAPVRFIETGRNTLELLSSDDSSSDDACRVMAPSKNRAAKSASGDSVGVIVIGD